MSTTKSNRETFEASGKLVAAKHKPKCLVLGRVVLQYQRAVTAWSYLTDKGILHTDYFSVGTIENTKNFKAFRVVMWKLKFTVAFV